MHQNLEQIRAAKALETATRTSKAAVSKLPAMIIANGLLATAAFAIETKKDGTPRRSDMKAALDGATQHLANQNLGITVLQGCNDAAGLLRKLSAADSIHLQRATSEALAFIGYVKRFTTKEGSEEGRDE